MSIKNLIENIKSKGLLQAMGLLDQLYQKSIENEEKLAAAEVKCAALAADNDKAVEVMRQADEVVKRAHSKFAALADENMALRSAIENGMTAPETPATDAYLADVRASAVDEACLKISNAIVNCYQDEQIGLDAAATICGDFAAQLRQEAAQ